MLAPSDIEPVGFISALELLGRRQVQAHYDAGHYRTRCYQFIIEQWLTFKTSNDPDVAKALVLLALADLAAS